MFNLVMRSFDWRIGRGTMPIDRFFEHTEESLANKFRQGNIVILDKLIRYPCLFMQEGKGNEVAYVGQVNRARVSGDNVIFEYCIDTSSPPLQNDMIYASRLFLDMPHDFEFFRNHWAVKDVDIYQFLVHNLRRSRQRPVVFNIDEHEKIEPQLASAMMPFDAGFGPVYESIKDASKDSGLHCKRADNIWENPAIIQDVVSLIDRSRVVVCDCSGRNPNVFYETGIAHTLGRDVIIITQNESDIPFDIKHLRYIKYLNNSEGLASLKDALKDKMQTLLGH